MRENHRDVGGALLEHMFNRYRIADAAMRLHRDGALAHRRQELVEPLLVQRLRVIDGVAGIDRPVRQPLLAVAGGFQNAAHQLEGERAPRFGDAVAEHEHAGARPRPIQYVDALARRDHRLARQQGSSSIYAFGPEDLAVWDDEAAPLEVEATSLDAFFDADRAPVDLVKIDAEGAEPAIVAGMTALLARSPHVRLVVELIPASLRRASEVPDSAAMR